MTCPFIVAPGDGAVYVPATTVVAGAAGRVEVALVVVVAAAAAVVAAAVLFPTAEPPDVTVAWLDEPVPDEGAADRVTTTGTLMVVGCLLGRKLTLGDSDVDSCCARDAAGRRKRRTE